MVPRSRRKTYEVHAQGEQIAAARTKQHEGAEDTGTRTAGGGRETKMRKQKSKEQERREKFIKEIITVLKAVIVTWAPVSATNQIRGPGHTVCRLLPTLANNGIKCQYCRSLSRPPH